MINKEWHQSNKMPKNPTIEQRIEWHLAHIKNCDCRDIPEKLKENLRAQNRQLIISDWCIGCRECEKVCKQNAINVINGKAVVDKERCVLCSYCAPRCKEFCIKII